ncbi:Signal peptidase I [Paenibacillus konkukensis]|uniref:Signal peptidase I n=1 Tax=Paenibacillus konkukensis TaxID=2020716 RepID=A0ABY4RHZ3_9BACL|nr:signal peptidase I [Paenibacillus konkukensis]UQZ81224.1 Signal peptidase I [Paenibacillus konkukensis]
MRFGVFILTIAVALAACAREPLRDNVTQENVKPIEATAGMVVYHHGYDNMDRGHHEYDNVDVVVDPTYYQANPVQRGDVVYYQNPKKGGATDNGSEKEISRIVALPGESIRIDKGQIYIDGRKLDTFYGQARRLGMNVQELQEASGRPGLADNIRENFKTNVKFILESEEASKQPIRIPDGQYYLIGDDWFRSADSRHFGTIPQESILGKVIGYKPYCFIITESSRCSAAASSV